MTSPTRTSTPAQVTKAARELVAGDTYDGLVIVRPPVPAGTRGHLWWKKDLVRVKAISTARARHVAEVTFDATEQLNVIPRPRP